MTDEVRGSTLAPMIESPSFRIARIMSTTAQRLGGIRVVSAGGSAPDVALRALTEAARKYAVTDAIWIFTRKGAGYFEVTPSPAGEYVARFGLYGVTLVPSGVGPGSQWTAYGTLVPLAIEPAQMSDPQAEHDPKDTRIYRASQVPDLRPGHAFDWAADREPGE